MAEDIKLVIGTDNPTVVVTTTDKVDIKNAAKSSDINFVATGSSGIKGDTGPQGPAGTGITTEQAAAIDANTAKNSFDGASINKLNNIEANAQVNRALLDEDNMASDSDTLAPTQQSVKAYVDGQTHLQIGTNSTNALAGNTTTITTSQSSAITANTNKTGITNGQASAITANTAKTGITTSQASAITANTSKTGITSGQTSAITANTSKNTNVSTNLGVTTGTTTVIVTSSDGDNATIPVATTSIGGVMSKAMFDQHTANVSKNTNVSTNLGITGDTGARVITSSDGDNATIPVATTSVSGLLTPSLFDEIDANTAKNTNATHSGDVTGSGALTIAADAVTYAKMQNLGTADRVLGSTSAGVIGETQIVTNMIATDAVTEDKLANTLLAEIDANTAKATNVSTNLSSTANGTSLTVESSDGNNVSLPAATTDAWGVMTDEMFDAVAANTAKETNVVQTTVTGNAGTATILGTARAINGVDFNGSAPITITAAGSTLSDTVPVSKGGTGATSFADKAVIITQDSGTDTLAAVAMSTNGQLLIGGTGGPAVATLTQGNGTIITNANGAITLAVASDIDTSGESGTVDNIGNLTGDVTSSNRATTIANDAVTYAKMQNVSATNVVLGRDSAGSGVVEEISAANLRTILNVADGATADQTNVTGSAGTVTSIGNLTGEVVSTNRATTIAKQKEIYFNNFDDKIGTTQLYIPFKSANEQTLPFAEEAAFLSPTDGRVVSVTVRGHIITGSGEVTISVRTFGLNASVSTSFTIEESKAHDINTADDHHAFHFVFDNAKHFESGELVAIGIKSDTNIDGFPATSFWYATTVVEYDWANQGFTAHQEYDSAQ